MARLVARLALLVIAALAVCREPLSRRHEAQQHQHNQWIDWWHDHPLTAALVSLVRLSIALLVARPVTGRPVWCAASAVSSATQLHAGHETLPLDTNLTQLAVCVSPHCGSIRMYHAAASEMSTY
eukprot:COSAG06_NODE_3623_length_5105_cov_2.312225_4_plen_125_part_00